MNCPGKIGNCLEIRDVEHVSAVGPWQEKRLRFEWREIPSARFLMNWNYYEAPNQMFVENVDGRGIVVTVRWALMKAPPAQLAELLNRWLEQCQNLTFKKSGSGGRRLQPT